LATDGTESTLVSKGPCDKCGSSDANATYSDGHAFCFVCSHLTPGEGARDAAPSEPVKGRPLVPPGSFEAIPKRALTEETCKKWGYSIGEFNDKKVHIATYRDDQGRPVAQKLRFQNKEFTTRGDFKRAGLYGQHLWGSGGKRVVIVEGEIDALSVSQAQNNRWPVVSIPNGAQGAAASIAKHVEWLSTFEEVVLMLDMDDVGMAAMVECAQVLPPGKAKIAHLPLKDASEMLQAGREEEMIRAIWNAKEWRPDGIVNMRDIRARAMKPIEMGLSWWLPSLTAMTYGRRYGEVYIFGAGTGIGKTDFLTQQILHDIYDLQEQVGLFFLEQQPDETGKRLCGKFAGKRFHVPDGTWEQAELEAAWDELEKNDRLHLYDHFGVAEWDKIEAQVRYLNKAHGVRLFYVDHLTALADPSNERESLETAMAQVGGLVKELGIIVHLVSHLATPEGKPHEEGGRVMIRHFKGARAIGFWAHFMFGLEREQQHTDPKIASTTTFRVLKDRYTGQATGKTLFLGYDVPTGRLYETDDPASDTHGFGNETGEDFTAPPSPAQDRFSSRYLRGGVEIPEDDEIPF
jgi:twinkle protein